MARPAYSDPAPTADDESRWAFEDAIADSDGQATESQLMRQHTLPCVAAGGRCKPGERCDG